MTDLDRLRKLFIEVRKNLNCYATYTFAVVDAKELKLDVPKPGGTLDGVLGQISSKEPRLVAVYQQTRPKCGDIPLGQFEQFADSITRNYEVEESNQMLVMLNRAHSYLPGEDAFTPELIQVGVPDGFDEGIITNESCGSRLLIAPYASLSDNINKPVDSLRKINRRLKDIVVRLPNIKADRKGYIAGLQEERTFFREARAFFERTRQKYGLTRGEYASMLRCISCLDFLRKAL